MTSTRPALARLLAFAVIWLALLAVGRTRMLNDPGTFWHVVIGNQILDTADLPTTDSLTFTRHGRPWCAQQWLAEIAMAGIHRIGSFSGLVLTAAAVLAATYAAVFRRFVDAGAAWPFAALLTGMLVAASSYHFHARPHIVTIALTAWLYALLCDVEAGRRSPRALCLCLPALVLWTNLHGGALGGIATLVLAAAAWTADGFIRRARSAQRRSLATVALIVAGAALLTPLVNPYGAHLPRIWLSLSTSAVLPRVIIEHAPPDFRTPEAWTLLALAGAYLLALAGADRRQFRVAWLLPIPWAVLAFLRVRHGPIFAAVAALAVADMLPGSRWVAWCAARGSDLLTAAAGPRLAPDHGTRLANLTLPAGLVAAALCVQSAGWPVPLVGADWARLSPDHWPVGAVPTLRQLAADEPHPARVFNEMRYGGFLAYFVPSARTYIDDRCELLGDEGLLAYSAMQADPQRLRPELDRYDLRLALVVRGSNFDRWFSEQPDWSPVYEDGAARLFARAAPPDSATASRPAIPVRPQ